MILEQWEADPALRQSLEAMLREPAMIAALEILRDQELRPLIHTSGDLVQVYALMGAKRTGYLEFLINLRDLARVTPRPLVEKKAWETEPPKPPE